MSKNRLPDYLDHIQQAATDACSFVEGMAKALEMLREGETLVVCRLGRLGRSVKLAYDFFRFLRRPLDSPRGP